MVTEPSLCSISLISPAITENYGVQHHTSGNGAFKPLWDRFLYLRARVGVDVHVEYGQVANLE